jgi:hypothetical protein
MESDAIQRRMAILSSDALRQMRKENEARRMTRRWTNVENDEEESESVAPSTRRP